MYLFDPPTYRERTDEEIDDFVNEIVGHIVFHPANKTVEATVAREEQS